MLQHWQTLERRDLAHWTSASELETERSPDDVAVLGRVRLQRVHDTCPYRLNHETEAETLLMRSQPSGRTGCTNRALTR